jgi:hypothetical protein
MQNVSSYCSNVGQNCVRSSVIIVTELGAEGPGFDSRQRQGYFLLATESRQVLGPTQPPVK